MTKQMDILPVQMHQMADAVYLGSAATVLDVSMILGFIDFGNLTHNQALPQGHLQFMSCPPPRHDLLPQHSLQLQPAL